MRLFNASTYQLRRKQLANHVKTGIILFIGNNESPMNYEDNTYPFRQDSTFLYFFGLSKPKLAAIIDCETCNGVGISGQKPRIIPGKYRRGQKTVTPCQSRCLSERRLCQSAQDCRPEPVGAPAPITGP